MTTRGLDTVVHPHAASSMLPRETAMADQSHRTFVCTCVPSKLCLTECDADGRVVLTQSPEGIPRVPGRVLVVHRSARGRRACTNTAHTQIR